MSLYTPSQPNAHLRIAYFTLAISLLVYLTTLIYNAWQGDDAFITWRTVDNIVNGYGMRWNAEERVQSYTSPLWMLVGLLCRLIFGEVYYSILFVSIALSLIIGLSLIKLARHYYSVGLVIIWMLIASNSFLDFTVSGLENPLSGILIVALTCSLFVSSIFFTALCTAMLMLCRPDAVLLALPALFLVLWINRQKKHILIFLILGLAPVVLWEFFSLIYYGSLIPNTAWAKLNISIPRIELLNQGGAYLLNSITHDPITLSIIFTCSAIGWIVGDLRSKVLVIGAFLYVFYSIWIGGDFMSGRFLFMPFVQSISAAAIAVREKKLSNPFLVPLCAGALFLYCFFWPNSTFNTLTADSTVTIIDSKGIADERAYYSSTTGLIYNLANHKTFKDKKVPIPPYRGSLKGVEFQQSTYCHMNITYSRLARQTEVGFLGYFAGPEKLILDTGALTDPFLARIPYIPKKGGWRIGHYWRDPPEGYMKTRYYGQNFISDSGFSAAYDDIRLVTRGELWTKKRWQAIWRLHTGYHDFKSFNTRFLN
jgi:arabinofuranosyltransferase